MYKVSYLAPVVREESPELRYAPGAGLMAWVFPTAETICCLRPAWWQSGASWLCGGTGCGQRGLPKTPATRSCGSKGRCFQRPRGWSARLRCPSPTLSWRPSPSRPSCREEHGGTAALSDPAHRRAAARRLGSGSAPEPSCSRPYIDYWEKHNSSCKTQRCLKGSGFWALPQGSD
ncbi:uncharacterized protein VSU04_011278 isoform 2-T2 [Chlamydotis macqueenii]